VASSASSTVVRTVAPALDPELLALPAPPEGRRNATLVLMAFVVTCSLALIASLRHDLAYFALSFRGAPATELGDVNALDPARLAPNTYVRVEGLPLSAGAVRFRRILSGAEYVVFPLAGQRTVFVSMPAELVETPRTSWAGRLVTFRQLGGRMAAVERHFAESLGMPVTGESYVLVLDEQPHDALWSVLLALVCLGFIGANAYLIVRWFRPIAPDREPPPDVAAA
jgi:hypothetical protein